MNRHHSPRSDPLDELLTILSDPQCRSVLSYFRAEPASVASVEEIAAESSEEGLDDEQALTRLIHSTLPRLGERGVIDFDARSNTVRYLGHADLEALLESIQATHQRALNP